MLRLSNMGRLIVPSLETYENIALIGLETSFFLLQDMKSILKVIVQIFRGHFEVGEIQANRTPLFQVFVQSYLTYDVPARSGTFCN